jgi:hypothetical protein
MATDFTPKNAKYFCEVCNFVSGKKSDYTRHLGTAKHKKNNANTTKIHQKALYTCECGRDFNDRSGLWRHTKRCKQVEQEETKENVLSDGTLLVELIKQNNEFKSLMVEQAGQIQSLQKQMMDIYKDGKTVNSHNTNSNNKVSLNLFLTEHCKDAMNIQEFIDSINFSIEELEETNKLGFVEGISKIMVNKLRELNTYERPMHCTDVKRETLYIKEHDSWQKDDGSKTRLLNVVEHIAKRSEKALPVWKKSHPNWDRPGTDDCDEFVELFTNLAGFQNPDKFRKQVMKNVMKEVVVSRDLL